MSLMLIETDEGPAIFHTEQLFGYGVAIVLFGVYYGLYVLFRTYMLPPGKSILSHGILEIAMIAFVAVIPILGIAATLYYCLYLTAPQLVKRDGIVIRKFFGLRIKAMIGTPYSFRVTKYLHTPYGTGKSLKLNDLLLVGPLGTHTVTVRGDKSNFVEIASALAIPIKYA